MSPSMESSREKRIKIVMFPWLAHGHVSPYLELSKKLTERNFHIYFCSSPIILDSIRPHISPKYSNSIQLVELSIPSLENLPPHNHTTKGLPPHLGLTLKRAFQISSSSFSEILQTLNPDLLICDFHQPWALPIASSLNIPIVNFSTSSATDMSLLVTVVLGEEDSPLPFVRTRDTEFHTVDTWKITEESDFGKCFKQASDTILVRTSYEFEEKALDSVSMKWNKKIFPTGPLVDENPVVLEDHGGIIAWLNKKEKSSTLFVSFGSEYLLTEDEREEIAYGLELSKVNFIWVIRFPLPQGFLERVGDRGIVVDGWAPQKRILNHSSICGFVSHCGWGSVIESVSYGVPIIAMPMQYDQPLNAKFVQDVGVGIEVKRDENGKFSREEINEVIQKVVLDANGQVFRKKARELSDCIRRNKDREMDAIADELRKLCTSNVL